MNFEHLDWECVCVCVSVLESMGFLSFGIITSLFSGGFVERFELCLCMFCF